MLRAFSVAFVIALCLSVCENAILTIFTWQSYIRSPEELQKAFKSDVKGVEALVDLTDGVPTIGEKGSDYSVETFINEVIDYHNRLENEQPTKFVVFYFYETDEIEVIQKTVDILIRKENEVNFPVWLRASLGRGVDKCRSYVTFEDAIGFVTQVLRLKHAVLGIRWTTYKHTRFDQGTYKKENTDEMYAKLKKAKLDEKIGQPINIFIRGHYAYRSRENLLDLYEKLKKTNPVTFTIYTDEQYYFKKDPVTPQNITELREAIQFLGPENVYLQVSDEIRADLDLRGLSNPRPTRSTAPPMVRWNFISLIIASVAVKLFEIFSF